MSLAFHRAHPERVRALLIIDTGPGFRDPKAREGWNRYALETAARLEKDGLAGMPGASAEVRASHHRSAEGLVRAARGMLTQRDAAVIDSLPTIAVPTLVIAGANDQPFLNATDYMAAKIPGAQKLIVPHAGHAVNLDQPEAFNAAVSGFLDRFH
jgi:pimeloyl-ACP methyl ester carboxylesterase